MRRSGELEAVDDVSDAAPAEGERVEAPSEVAPGPAPVPPSRIWSRPPTGMRGLAPVPAFVSRSVWTRLARQIAGGLRNRTGGAVSLRGVVRVLNAEMRLAGATRADVEAALRLAVAEHPQLDTLDRVSVVTRQRASDALLERMLACLD